MRKKILSVDLDIYAYIQQCVYVYMNLKRIRGKRERERGEIKTNGNVVTIRKIGNYR